MTNLTEIARSTQGILYSGEKVFSAQMDTLEAISDGVYKIQDPTNPFVNLSEMAAVVGSALKFDREITMRKMFPVMSQMYQDLYLHMSDEDYLNRFATPATTLFNFLFRKDEIISKAVPVPGSSIKKMVLPRYTNVTINGITHTLSYPIEFRVLAHGGLQILYDTDEVSPLQVLESNIIDHRIVRDRSGIESILMTVPLTQYLLTTYLESLNPSTGFTKSFEVTDKFYYCRVYQVRKVGGEDIYTEMSTTHSEMIYDIKKPTALLTVLEDRIQVHIPQIYFNAGLLSYKLRVDVFTTKGQLLVDLADYDAGSFIAEYGDGLESKADSVYSAPIAALNVKGAWSSAVIDGGGDGLTVAELRERVINNSVNPKVIITDAQLQSRLQVSGYDVVLAIDNISSRVFYATRNLPPPTQQIIADDAVDISNFTTGAGCSIDTVKVTMAELAGLPFVRDNGLRMTITPGALYKYVNGVPKLLSPAEIPTEANGLDALVSTISSGSFAYSPFYYVLDATSEIFDCRVYHMDSPTIPVRSFVAENQTSGLQIATGGYYIEKLETGYRILVTTVSDDAYKAIDVSQRFVQLGFVPPREIEMTFINGVLFGNTAEGDDVWEFILNSRMDITALDELYLDDFSMFAGDFRSFPSRLLETFSIFYSVSDYDYFGLQKTEIDNRMGRHLLPASVVGLTEEKLIVRFGTALKNLWVNGRTAPSAIKYLTYEVDVPQLWAETKYVSDANDVPIFTIDPVTDEIVYEVVHRKGDPVMINGEVVYLHRAGDPVYVDGELVPIEDRQSLRLLDIFLVDGVYFYTDYPTDVSYRASIANTVTSYVTEFLAPLSSTLLQKTKLFFYPKKTIGDTKMIVGNQIETSLPAGLSFAVRPHISAEVYRDEGRKKAINQAIAETINKRLSRPTVSISDIMESMREAIGDDVIAFDMDKMGPNKDIAAFTAIDDSRRCSVKRILEVQPDQTLRVREDIVVDWVVHRA